MRRFVEKNSGSLVFVGPLLGFIWPHSSHLLNSLLPWILMWMLFLSFMRLDLGDLWQDLRRPLLLIYLMGFLFLILPVGIYFLGRAVDPVIGVGALLIAAMPGGVSAPAITELFRGRLSLTLILVCISSLLCVVSIPALFTLLNNATLQIDSVAMLFSLLKLVLVPLVAAQIVRRLSPSSVEAVGRVFSIIAVSLFIVVGYTVVGDQSRYILAHWQQALGFLLANTVLFVLLHAVGYFAAFWLPREERMALSISRALMNTVLAVVLAHQFFADTPAIILFAVMSLIPWYGMIGYLHFWERLEVRIGLAPYKPMNRGE